MHIANVEKLPLSTTGSPLLIRCKTFLSITFVIPKERECHDVYTTLTKLYQPVHIKNLYCFQYTTATKELSKATGWDYFKLESEFKRMRVPNEQWSACTLNQSYELCDTYPQQIYVPAEANTQILLGSSRFRSKGRLPALTYLHANKASICRCSQPLSGFSARCLEDEQMLETIRKTNPNYSFMYVVDTRPRVSHRLRTFIQSLVPLSSSVFVLLFLLVSHRLTPWRIEPPARGTRTRRTTKISSSSFSASKTSTQCVPACRS